MKFSSLQILAIVCILAVGFMTVTPFVPKTDADCNYYSQSMCKGAAEYAAKKVAIAAYTCYMDGPNSESCRNAAQTAQHAAEWASWVCAHADS